MPEDTPFSAASAELDRLYDDCSYSAQAYFEAAKSAEFWGRTIVFLPAVAAAIASLLFALGGPRSWGSVGAVAGAIAATASFLGSERKANSLKESARKYTVLRHAARVEKSFISDTSNPADLEARVRSLRDQYAAVVSANELAGNRFFKRAQERIGEGVLKYDTDNSAT